MIDKIKEIDQLIFLKINSWNSPFLDQVMWFLSGKVEWIPLYIILLFLLIKTYKGKFWIYLVTVGVLVVLTDQISVKLFKEVFERYRPCHNLDLQSIVHLVNNKCGGKFGFVSSHATNTFGTAVLLSLFLKQAYKKLPYLLIFWAFIVSYSRIYLGVHYPSDVIAGAILGTFLAVLVYHFFNRLPFSKK